MANGDFAKWKNDEELSPVEIIHATVDSELIRGYIVSMSSETVVDLCHCKTDSRSINRLLSCQCLWFHMNEKSFLT